MKFTAGKFVAEVFWDSGEIVGAFDVNRSRYTIMEPEAMR